MKKLLAGLVALVVAVGGVQVYRYSPMLSGASGYAAKNICSGHFVSGFDGQAIVDEALVGASPLLARFAFKIDEDARSVETSLFGLYSRTATYLPGTGCKLLVARQTSATPANNIVVRNYELTPDTMQVEALDGQIQNQIATLLEAAFEETSADMPRNTKAVVILHKGKLVAERYAQGVDERTPLLGWSMNKSITGLVTGLMVGDGLLNIQAPAPVPAWHETEGDPRAAITLDHLMRMSSGLIFNETYDVASDVQYMLSNASDAGGFAATKELVADPDTLWSYSSGTTNIVSGILKRASGGTLQSHYDYVQERLFGPLGITTAVLETDAAGTFIGSSYGYASARDWARLGQFCLQDGSWEGEQLLPEDWMTYSTAPTHTNPGGDYGAHFWLNVQPENPEQPRAWPTLPTDAYFMSGYQGQFVAIVPSKDLVVVRLGFTPGWNHGAAELVASAIEISADFK